MSRIERQSRLSIKPEALWQVIGSFQRVDSWHPMVAKVSGEGEQAGAIRRPETRDGHVQTEQLIEIDGQRRLMRYRILETPLPVTDWFVELRVDDNGDGTSTVSVTEDFRDASGNERTTEQIVQGFVTAGLNSLQKRFNESPVSQRLRNRRET